ncbi:hypothetical protein BT96DRAFT_1013007 [Gymnopus androsaceus JB14]|uniref:Rhodopsin domain-containing protein n=1 Tax=Gymnopus androsaceus JB14 TaxID=1447944 RepID=A0A6A4IJY4_9AGAR|nr:hypothetical protein BT96DRAFT_1013007 [Gymnopus androsaceus JB14]
MVLISITTWRITATVLAGVGQIITLLRVIYRAKKRQLWVDDVLAALSGLLSFVALPCLWIYTDYLGVGPLNQSQHNRLMAYWVLSGTFIAIVWLTRLSLVCSLLRIVPRSIRPIAYIASAVFSLMGIALFIQEIMLCHSDTSWESLGGMNLQCSGNQAIMATEIALEFFSNIALVTMLIRIIAIFKTVALRRLVILAILIGSLLISGGSIAHAVYLIQNTGLLARFTASIQASSSLIIINLQVLVVFFSLLTDPGREDPDNLSMRNRDSQTALLSTSYARLSGLKLRIGSPTESSFFTPEKSSVYHLNPLPQLQCDRNSDSSQYSQETQPDEQGTRLSTFFSGDLHSADSRISSAMSSTTDGQATQLSTFFREHFRFDRANDKREKSPAIPSTLFSDDISLSRYPFLNRPPSFVPSDRYAPSFVHSRRPAPLRHPMTDSLVSPYPLSIYSQYLRDDDPPPLPSMPAATYETSNRKAFQLPSQVLSAMRPNIPSPTADVPKPF